ncbi:hypothetical protein D3C77_303070 [compost metagenome]
MQRGPLEETGLVQQQADDDDGDEGGGGVPDNGPHGRDVVQRNGTRRKGDEGTERGTPANTKPLRLPDDQDEGENEDCNGDQHEDLARR